MNPSELIVGIDLGTTNSEIAAFVEGKVQLLGPTGAKMLPSCVGISPDGELLVGRSAQNQMLIYPERTVRSIKRQMGQDVKTSLGDQEFSPAEISGIILKELASWAERALEKPATKAVITVPAYFSDAQRSATREAGALAGLEVVRILNEPTAASLAYGYGDTSRQTVLVYDLGGGTFDVSIVSIEGDITEVLASHGNNQLGGDDFNQLILDRLLQQFQDEHGIDLRDRHPVAYSRLWWAAEEAKQKLSFEPYVTVREESLVTAEGKPLHLESELSRRDYEDLIRPQIETTLDSVTKALDDADKKPSDLDAIILVGGSTRTPLVRAMLEELARVPIRQDVHPDLCVALGAGVLASRLAGQDIERVLVDISPYSFGPAFVGELEGRPYLHCYRPIIQRNTPLPVTRAESYYTMHPYQTEVQLEIYQGDDPDALKNTLVGEFSVTGLTPMEEDNEVLCRMGLDLDGILHVTAIEKITGKSKHVTISDVFQPLSDIELAGAQRRLEGLYARRAEAADETPESFDLEDAEGLPTMLVGRVTSEATTQDTGAPETDGSEAEPEDPEWAAASRKASELLERSRGRLATMHDEDQEEAIDLHERIENALAERDRDALSGAAEELQELLFFVEGK